MEPDAQRWPIRHPSPKPSRPTFPSSCALLTRGRTYETPVKILEPYERIQQPDEAARSGIVAIAEQSIRAKRPAFVRVNNRLEGNAPGTIEAVVAGLGLPWSPTISSDDLAATFFVNPASVLAMVRHVLAVPKGAWLLQSAAGSTLGRMIIKLGRHDGFKTLNVVRRRKDAIDELKALGGDAVIRSSEGPTRDQVQDGLPADGVRVTPSIRSGGETGTESFDRSPSSWPALALWHLVGPAAQNP